MKSGSPSRYLNLLREREDRSPAKYIPGFDIGGKIMIANISAQIKDKILNFLEFSAKIILKDSCDLFRKRKEIFNIKKTILSVAYYSLMSFFMR